MQLTIPINIARKVGIEAGEKIKITEYDGNIIITPVKRLIEELAGSLSVPEKWKNVDIEAIIHSAKSEYFKGSKSKNLDQIDIDTK